MSAGTSVAQALAGKGVTLDSATAVALSRARVDLTSLLSMSYADLLYVPGIGPARVAWLKVCLTRAGYEWPADLHSDAGLHNRERAAIAHYLRTHEVAR